jgi:hypothetical protein
MDSFFRTAIGINSIVNIFYNYSNKVYQEIVVSNFCPNKIPE